MFGFGATEILVILIVVLVLLGMGKLPDVARKAGSAYRGYRKVDQEIQKYKDPTTWIDTIAPEEKKDEPPNSERKT